MRRLVTGDKKWDEEADEKEWDEEAGEDEEAGPLLRPTHQPPHPTYQPPHQPPLPDPCHRGLTSSL